MLTLFPKRSPSAWWDIERRQRAEIRAEHATAALDKLLALYIKESKRPDCDPAMRFRVTLPSGAMAYRPTREEAEDLLRTLVSEAAR